MLSSILEENERKLIKTMNFQDDIPRTNDQKKEYSKSINKINNMEIDMIYSMVVSNNLEINNITKLISKETAVEFMHKFAKIGRSDLLEQILRYDIDINGLIYEDYLGKNNIIESIIVGYKFDPLSFDKSLRIIDKYKPEKKIKKWICALLFDNIYKTDFAIEYINTCVKY
jgi:hypothetical protein